MPNWRKIKDLRFDELRERSSQKLAAFGERTGLSSLATLPSESNFRALIDTNVVAGHTDLLEHFRTRSNPQFFAGMRSKEFVVQQLRGRWSAAAGDILARADGIVSGRFNLLGFRDLEFGDPISWHFEPIAKKQTPLIHWSRLNYLDPELAGDKKIVWELNRHQFFVTLGQAYWLTDDERYAKAFTRYLESWLDQNPPKLGINWSSSLEIAFRSISWLWAFHFFRDSPTLSTFTFERALRFLYLNARHLETYLSTYFSPNTHLTGEALGLFYLGLLLPEFKDSARWRDAGTRVLLEQLPIQVLPDGVYFEQSSYYHRYTTDFFTHFVILSKANETELSTEVEGKLIGLIDHLMYITRPDGTTPFFGDDDGGRLMMLDDRPPNDFRSTLSTAAAFFERSDYKFVAEELAAETVWLLGKDGVERFDAIFDTKPAKTSVGFENGGYYVMRDDWSADANYLLFDCGPHGAANCGHAHADALSFELAANGRTTLVDPGTFTYTGSRELRDWFRRSAAHNTLTIDDASSSISAGPFSWRTIALTELLAWITQQRFDYIVASHNGFHQLPGVGTHTRRILFLKHDYWIIRDHLPTAGSHRLKLWLHFALGVAPLSGKSDEVYVLAGNDHGTRMYVTTFGGGGDWTEEPGWVSSCYGEKEQAPVFAYSRSGKLTGELVTFLVPQGSGINPRPVVREIEANDGRAFEITIGEQHDVLLIRNPGDESTAVETTRFVSDFEITWARFLNQNSRMPNEMVLIGGTRLDFEGREILQAGERINHLSLSIHGDQVRRESDEGILDLAVSATDFESFFADLNYPAGLKLN